MTGSNDGRSLYGTDGLNTINSTTNEGEKESDSENDELKELQMRTGLQKTKASALRSPALKKKNSKMS